MPDRPLFDRVKLHLETRACERDASPYVRHALTLLHELDDEIPRAGDIYAQLPCSESTAKRQFLAEVGVSVGDYIAVLLLVRSLSTLLRYPDYDVRHVAHLVGYTQLSSLVRAWTRELGYTPGWARRMIDERPVPFPAGDMGLLAAAIYLDKRAARRPASPGESPRLLQATS